MPFLAWLARMFMLRRLFGGQSGRRQVHGRRGYPVSSRGAGRSPRRRESGFGFFGPVPTYSRRTRGGGRVSVGGCCLPIPIGMGVLAAGAVKLLGSQR